MMMRNIPERYGGELELKYSGILSHHKAEEIAEG